jgi:hypothetical protein
VEYRKATALKAKKPRAAETFSKFQRGFIVCGKKFIGPQNMTVSAVGVARYSPSLVMESLWRLQVAG